MLRRRQQRLLRDIAGRCGFTVSLLSKIESGKVNPPIATLAKIAAALGVGLSDLLSDAAVNNTVFVPSGEFNEANLTRTDKGYAFQLLAGSRPGKAMQPFMFVAERGKVQTGAMTHEGEEFVYVIEGRMNYRVGSTTYTLGPGDSLYFDSLEEHDLEPITDKVKFLALFTSPSPPAKPAPSKRKGKS